MTWRREQLTTTYPRVPEINLPGRCTLRSARPADGRARPLFAATPGGAGCPISRVLVAGKPFTTIVHVIFFIAARLGRAAGTTTAGGRVVPRPDGMGGAEAWPQVSSR